MIYNDMFDAITDYNRNFEDGFPMFRFSSYSEKEIIKICDTCLDADKDVYEMGYIEREDEDAVY